MLLDRYGIVTRDVVLAEGIPGGFSGLYPAFSSLEDVGSVRRGYFVEGMGGAQFALPGAIERVRRLDPSSLVVLAATDPANPYGAAVPWPDSAGTPERRAGALVALSGWGPVAWMDPAGRRIITFGAEDVETVRAIEDLSQAHGRVTIATIDEREARDHPLSGDMVAAGFVSGYKGFTIRPRIVTEGRTRT